MHSSVSPSLSWSGMKTMQRSLRLIVSVAVISVHAILPGPVAAQELKPTEALAIAREAYGYGLPIVENYKTMYANAIDQT